MRLVGYRRLGGREWTEVCQRVENSAFGGSRIDARAMVTRCRCTECRRGFVASRKSGENQCTCCEVCRLARRRKQARKRRRKDLEGFRADERDRQQNRRARQAEARALAVAEATQAEFAARGAQCHAPASVLKSLKVQEEIHRILDGPFRLSRAGFERELRRVERKIGSIVRQAVAQYGP